MEPLSNSKLFAQSDSRQDEAKTKEELGRLTTSQPITHTLSNEGTRNTMAASPRVERSPSTEDEGTFRSFAFGGSSASVSRSGSLTGNTARTGRLNSFPLVSTDGVDRSHDTLSPSSSSSVNGSGSSNRYSPFDQQPNAVSSSHESSPPANEPPSPPPTITHDFSTFRFGSATSSINPSYHEGYRNEVEFLGTPTAELGPFEYPVLGGGTGGGTRSSRSSVSVGDSARRSRLSSVDNDYQHQLSPSGSRRNSQSASRSRQRSSPQMHPTMMSSWQPASKETEVDTPMAGLSIDLDDAMVRAATSMRRTSTTTMVPSVPAGGRRPSVQHSATQPAGVPILANVAVDKGGIADQANGGVSSGYAQNQRTGGGSFSSNRSSTSSASSSHGAAAASMRRTSGPISPSLSASSSSSTSSSSAATHASQSNPRQTVQRIVASIAQADAHLAAHTGRRPSILLFSSQQPKEGPVPPSLLNHNLNSHHSQTRDVNAQFSNANMRRGSLPTHHLTAKRLDMLQHQAVALQDPLLPVGPPTAPSPLTGKRSSLSVQGGLPRVSHPGTTYERTSVSAAYLYHRRSSLAFPPSAMAGSGLVPSFTTASSNDVVESAVGPPSSITGLELLRPRRRRSSSLSSSTSATTTTTTTTTTTDSTNMRRPSLQRSHSNASSSQSRSSAASTLTARSTTTTPGGSNTPSIFGGGPTPEPGYSFGSQAKSSPSSFVRSDDEHGHTVNK